MSICIVSYLVHNTGVHSKQSNESLCLEKRVNPLYFGVLSHGTMQVALRRVRYPVTTSVGN